MSRKHKADCTPEEWQAILSKARQYYADNPDYAESIRKRSLVVLKAATVKSSMTLQERKAKNNLAKKRWFAANREERNAYARKWQAEHRSAVLERRRKARLANPQRYKEQIRKENLKRSFNITPEQYEAIFNAQGGVCAICHRLPKPHRRLAVDHNHTTGANRGLLCSACNLSVGLLEMDPDWNEKALNYLAQYIEQTVKEN